MPRHILILQGHPDPARGHLCHALADAYGRGAALAGHALRVVEVAQLDFPWLRSQAAFEQGPLPPSLKPAQDAIAWADHLVIAFPLWLGGMPALLKAFLEQVARPDFTFGSRDGRHPPERLLKGKSARIIVTMGMPVFFYRWYFGAHGLKSLKRSILGFVGIGPVRESLFGLVETAPESRRAAWLARMERLGRDGF
jgi:putative NADPH-quinone reductase